MVTAKTVSVVGATTVIIRSSSRRRETPARCPSQQSRPRTGPAQCRTHWATPGGAARLSSSRWPAKRKTTEKRRARLARPPVSRARRTGWRSHGEEVDHPTPVTAPSARPPASRRGGWAPACHRPLEPVEQARAHHAPVSPYAGTLIRFTCSSESVCRSYSSLVSQCRGNRCT